MEKQNKLSLKQERGATAGEAGREACLEGTLSGFRGCRDLGTLFPVSSSSLIFWAGTSKTGGASNSFPACRGE